MGDAFGAGIVEHLSRHELKAQDEAMAREQELRDAEAMEAGTHDDKHNHPNSTGNNLHEETPM